VSGKEASYADFDALLRRAADALCADATTWFPNPYEIGRDAGPVDAVSVREFIDASGGDPEFRMLNEVFWGTNSQARCADVSAVWAFAWYAYSGFDARLVAENIYTFKLEGGMGRLMQAILSDGSPEIRFGTRVTAIAQTTSGVTSTLRDGEDLESRAVVVATPLNTWSSIDFEPELSDPKRELTARGHAGRGVKVMVRVRGRHDLNVALPESYPLTWLQPEYLDEDETIFVAFGLDGEALTPMDDAGVGAALDMAIPGLEVLEVIGHDWAGDDLSRGTWASYRPGQLTGLVPAARKPEGRVAFASSDISRGWISLVDGGIESGLTAALTTRRTLEA
jgi:monoamine oxidase